MLTSKKMSSPFFFSMLSFFACYQRQVINWVAYVYCEKRYKTPIKNKKGIAKKLFFATQDHSFLLCNKLYFLDEKMDWDIQREANKIFK